MKPSSWLPLAAMAVALIAVGKPPVIDEESYLWIGAHLDVLRPYDWEREWQGSSAWLYAHPPLWLLWMAVVGGHGLVVARLASLPLAGLLGWSVGRLAERACHHPSLAAGTWLAAPTVLLGLQDTLMIDLPAVALATAAVALYRDDLEDPRGWRAALGGVCLGLAIETKYPAALLVPVLLVHSIRFRAGWRFWAGMLGVVVLVEGWLAALYGGLHPIEVWRHRGEIAAGPMSGRWLGTLLRLALIPSALVLFRSHIRLVAVGFAIAVVTLAILRPDTGSAGGAVFALVLGGLGGTLLVRAAVAAASSPARRRKGDRGESLLLGGWVVMVVIGVVALHNYASARYLLPAAAPAALLVVRAAEEVPSGKFLQRLVLTASALVGIALIVADWRYARATVEVARLARAAAAEAGYSGNQFAGEWGFRYDMEGAGWVRLPAGALPTGIVAVVENASPGPLPLSALEPLRRVESDDTFPLRVVDVESRAGLYAETIGLFPFWVGRGPLEAATVYAQKGRVP